MPQIHMITNGIPPCAGCPAHGPVVDPYPDPGVITALIGADLEGMPRQQERRKQQTATVEEPTRAGQCKAIDEVYEKIEEMRKAM